MLSYSKNIYPLLVTQTFRGTAIRKACTLGRVVSAHAEERGAFGSSTKDVRQTPLGRARI